MHVERLLTVGTGALDRAASFVVDSVGLLNFVVFAILLPVGTYIASQIAAAIIGLYAQRYWLQAFQDSEKKLLHANGTLRSRIRKLLRVNATLVSQNAQLVGELERANRQADAAETLLAEITGADVTDYVI